MGALCSRSEPVDGAHGHHQHFQDDYDLDQRKDHSHTDFMTRLSRRTTHPNKRARMGEPTLSEAAAARNHIQAHDAEISAQGAFAEVAVAENGGTVT
mgnify:CR=1 FL=1